MRCGICHATLTVCKYRETSGKRRVPLYHPCPRLNDATFHPARAERSGPWDRGGLQFDRVPKTKKTVAQRIVDAEALAARYLGNYNEEIEAGRAKGAEKMLAKSQHWLDVANKLRGWS